ncbi:hypothetical protein AB6A40_000781 [Gnathostoma spinigerum]|uniref:UDENN domain-containing protein n=1 Tax=Gnathostoma spinigerum TaxID=75299 RepID=A0ABD6EBL4_9BILA
MQVKSVCHAVQSLASLLLPFSWPYTLVPVLPDTLLELANSPTPYLMGVLRNNLYKLKDLLLGNCDDCCDDLLQGCVVIVDLDGGIFVPQPSELYIASHGVDYKERSALALCERLLLPKKLALSLISSFKEALSFGIGPRADDLLQKSVISWYASLIGHYKACGFHAAFNDTELKGDVEPFRTAAIQLVSAHTSRSSRRFTEWFVETGIFRDWIRRRVTINNNRKDPLLANSEDAANQKLDELSLTLAPSLTHKRLTSIFSKAHSALFRTHLIKKL